MTNQTINSHCFIFMNHDAKDLIGKSLRLLKYLNIMRKES